MDKIFIKDFLATIHCRGLNFKHCICLGMAYGGIYFFILWEHEMGSHICILQEIFGLNKTWNWLDDYWDSYHISQVKCKYMYQHQVFSVKTSNIIYFCKEIRKIYRCILVILRHTVVNFSKLSLLIKTFNQEAGQKEIRKTHLNFKLTWAKMEFIRF